ncbi:MAG: hypothetical protein AAGA93_27290 [Actinomycetota bacterium]
MAFVLAGCGGDDDETGEPGASSSGSASPTASASTAEESTDADTAPDDGDAAEAGESSTDQEAPDDEGADEAGAGGGDAVIGSDAVIVDLGDLLWDLAILDIPVAGNIYGADFLAEQIVDVEGIEPEVLDRILEAPIVTSDGVDVELIATIDPDVILTTAFFGMFYETPAELDQVSPVVTIDDLTVDWRERSLAVAELAGRTDDMQARIDAADAAVAALADRVAAAGLDGRTVSFVRSIGDGQFTTFARESTPFQVIEAVGLAAPEAIDVEQGDDSPFPFYAAQRFLSLELAPDVEADVVFVGFVPEGGDPAAALPGAESLIPALSDGRALDVNYFLWALNSVVGVEEIVEDLERAVALLEERG